MECVSRLASAIEELRDAVAQIQDDLDYLINPPIDELTVYRHAFGDSTKACLGISDHRGGLVDYREADSFKDAVGLMLDMLPTEAPMDGRSYAVLG